MDVKESYNLWAGHYDSGLNKTRDLEALALRETLSEVAFENCLEIGCGTGKNTQWLLQKATHITAVDFSEAMLLKAKERIKSALVNFKLADVINDWDFLEMKYDLICFSLVLEHIENLDGVFKKASIALRPNGYIYIGELHPYKQYSGTKARFDIPGGQHVITCFNHHISAFTHAAKENGFEVIQLKEYFDQYDHLTVPRILTLLLQKK